MTKLKHCSCTDSSTNFIRLAYKIHVTFQRYANGFNVSQRNAASKFFQNLFMLKARKSLSLCIL